MAIARGTYSYGYDPTTGQVRSISAPGGGSLTYSYAGPLLTSMTWSGSAVTGTVGFGYDNDFRIISESVAGSMIAYTYDADGLLTGSGALTLQRNAQTGLLSGTTIGTTTGTTSDAFTYNEFGEPSGYTATASGSLVFSETPVRDQAGRISRSTETVAGASRTFDYFYDTAGRLTDVIRDGSTTTSYRYDPNSNRQQLLVNGSALLRGSYDDQDRLLAYGDTAYTYTAAGELATRTDSSGTTTFVYDELGNLTRVTVPGGTTIEYLIDGQNRRIGKRIDGTIVQGFLYGDQLRVVAELGASGNPVSRFVYGSRSNVPDYLIKGGITYRIISDHLGSPRVVVDPSTGAIVQQLDYDEFGNVLLDTNPGFQPFGFAGGLYDAATKLVRFGARDYDPHTARWTTKEPLLFSGGDTNFYSYVFNDPIQMLDPTGEDALCYDGTTLWLSNDAGQTVLARPATSGRDGITDPAAEDQGPIPPGTYAVLPPEISEVSGLRYAERNLLGDWGKYRVPLHPLPGTNTQGRGGFFVHGGDRPGSAGCVDVGHAEDEIFKRLKTSQGPLALRVGKCR